MACRLLIGRWSSSSPPARISSGSTPAARADSQAASSDPVTHSEPSSLTTGTSRKLSPAPTSAHDLQHDLYHDLRHDLRRARPGPGRRRGRRRRRSCGPLPLWSHRAPRPRRPRRGARPRRGRHGWACPRRDGPASRQIPGRRLAAHRCGGPALQGRRRSRHAERRLAGRRAPRPGRAPRRCRRSSGTGRRRRPVPVRPVIAPEKAGAGGSGRPSPTTRLTSLRAPPNGATVNFTSGPGQDGLQVSRRGTCICVTVGAAPRGVLGRAQPGRWRGGRAGGGGSSSAGLDPDGQGCRLDGSGALEPVEARGDRSDRGVALPGLGELVHVGVEEALVCPAGPPGEPFEVVGGPGARR